MKILKIKIQNRKITENLKFIVYKLAHKNVVKKIKSVGNLKYFGETKNKININLNDEILASDYSYGQIYFEIVGKKKNLFLNKLTNFDLRPKKFPKFTMAQTLISRIDCYIYNLDEKFIVTCNKSYENYFKERFVLIFDKISMILFLLIILIIT